MKNDKNLIISKIMEAYNFKNDSDFAKHLEISRQRLSNWKERGSYDINLLYTKCEYINPAFLITGKGDVIIKEEELKFNNISNNFALRTDKQQADQLIPLYDLEASAGLVPLFDGSIAEVPKNFISIPNLPKCDGALPITGDSMYPLLKSGDIILYKQISDIINNIFFGEMYLLSLDVDGEEFVTVKFIQKSDKGDEYIKLVSQNTYHQPKDVHLSKLKALALVKASIRMNAMS